ncbi:MAG: methyltransferase domain-containing protein [Thermoguttaceae bacterium]|jgi:SAM-dependent methyltransferase
MQRVIPGVLAMAALTSFASYARCDDKAAGDKTPDCVYVGTPNDVVAKMLDMAKITKDDVVYDPGCGDGRMVIAAARKYGCRGVGFEIVPKLVAEGRQIAKKRKVDHLVTIEDKDIYTVDYSKATVISMYLLPDMIVKLRPLLEKMKPGSRIVAHDYAIKDVAPDDTQVMTSNEDNVKHTLYLYTLPLKKEAAGGD